MSLSLGIVGLPNVGKSTLFNALTRSKQANVANYPFCTIEPNVGVVEVPDDRLQQLSRISASKKTVPAAIEFVDIAGLVKGASEGEGLGNKFLSHIREADAIVQVVRAFKDSNILHVNAKVDPGADAVAINIELALADIQIVTKRLATLSKNAKSSTDQETKEQIELLQRVLSQLQTGGPARALAYTKDELDWMKELQLLTMKPMMYVVNVDELSDYRLRSENYSLLGDDPSVTVCAKLEAEMAELAPAEATAYLKELGLEQSGLDKIIVTGYKLLDLITYFTSGEPETRAWTIQRGWQAPAAAGVIHTDFIKGFVKADVCSWQDFVNYRGWDGVREQGKLRLEGRAYVVQDGDVCYWHIAT